MAGRAAQRLRGQPGTTGLPATDALVLADAGRLNAEFGYGITSLNGRGLLATYVRVALTEGIDQTWHLGTRLALAESLNPRVEASRRQRECDMAGHELALRVDLGWQGARCLMRQVDFVAFIGT